MSLQSVMAGRKAYSTHLKGNQALDAKKYDEAQKFFDQAQALYADALEKGNMDPRILLAYGVLLLKQREFARAHDIMLKTETIKTLSLEQKRQLRLNFAICQWKLGKLDQAIALMRRVAEDGKNSTVYNTLGYLLIEKAKETRDFAEAVQFNAEAFDYDEDDPVTLDNMGQLSLAMGERDQARAYFKKAMIKKPSQVDTLYYLAVLAHEDGNDPQAREYLNKALTCHYSALCTTTREQAQALLGELK